MRHVVVLAAAVLVGCAMNPPVGACTLGTPLLMADLFFGRSLPAGGAVTNADWRDFLAREVTPRFPDGLTVLEGYGQWRQRATNRATSEPSTVVIIVTQPGSETLRRLDAIREAYNVRFHQQSVGLAMESVCASF